MAIKTHSPEIDALKNAVEKRIGHVIETRSDFTSLSIDIERVTHEHLAENTLRRLWGKMKGYDTVFTRTLDVLSSYAGYKHWAKFCNIIENGPKIESEIVKNEDCIRVEDLHRGDCIRIGWLPDRVCVIEYQGGRIFKAVDCKNSTLQAGDSFECGMILKHFPLFVDNLVHGGELCQRYSMGLDNGLTIVEKL